MKELIPSIKLLLVGGLFLMWGLSIAFVSIFCPESTRLKSLILFGMIAIPGLLVLLGLVLLIKVLAFTYKHYKLSHIGVPYQAKIIRITPGSLEIQGRRYKNITLEILGHPYTAENIPPHKVFRKKPGDTIFIKHHPQNPGDFIIL